MKKIIAVILILLFPMTVFAADKFRISAKTKKHQTGFRMCAKKSDKPHKSEQNKKWHLDRECCLDQYEVPNPSCFYGAKYQNLINKYNKKFLWKK